MGRYLRASSRRQGPGLSVSTSARPWWRARELTAEFPGVSVVRGDTCSGPPSPQGAYDYIYSLGVLDHTPNPRAAFLQLAKLLRPGGRIAVWVYPKERPALERVINFHRAVSSRLPLGVLVALSRLMAPVGSLKRTLMTSRQPLAARLGVMLNVLTIGVSMHPDPEVRVCDTLDWYAPKYLSRHTKDEVQSWFVEAGLVDVTDLSEGQRFYHAGQGNGVTFSGRRAD